MILKLLEASGNPKTPQFATGALGVPKANIANKSVTYGWSGRGDLNTRPPAPRTVDPLIWASIDSRTCGVGLLNREETSSYNLDNTLAISTGNRPTKPDRKTDDETNGESCWKFLVQAALSTRHF